MVKLLSSPQYFVPDATITDVSGKSELLRQICREESDSCKEFFASLDLLSIISAAEAIRKSKRIFICAHDISHVLAEFLAARLKLLYFEPKMIDLNNLNDTQEKLEMLTSDDIVIFIAFPKYYYPLGSIAKNAFSRGAQILTITDSVSSPTVPVQQISAALPHLHQSLLQLADFADGTGKPAALLPGHRLGTGLPQPRPEQCTVAGKCSSVGAEKDRMIFSYETNRLRILVRGRF